MWPHRQGATPMESYIADNEVTPWAPPSDDQQHIPLSESWLRSKPEKVPETNVASIDNTAPHVSSELLLPSSPRNHMSSKMTQQNNKDRKARTYSESCHPWDFLTFR